MSQTNNQKSSAQAAKNTDQEVEILYQRIGTKWYAFSVINDDVYFGALETDPFEADSSAHLRSPEQQR